ncbi:MAG: hypothetical protein J6Q78_02165 [Clostridia bacterium]|nr:hypothetical protein [Clostridia bacterium]
MQKKFALIDSRASAEITASLSIFGYEVIKMPQFCELSGPISCHPDMLIAVLQNTIYCHEKYFSAAKDIFFSLEKEGYTVKMDDHMISHNYPYDISYNCSVIQNKVFALVCHMSPTLKKDCSDLHIELINVRQGYTKCSSALVGDKGIISSDASILKAAEQRGIRTLRISEGNIELQPYSHGFIGGATGYDNGKMFFAGNYMTHPDGKEMESFCKSFGIEPISLANGNLTDIGTILFI